MFERRSQYLRQLGDRPQLTREQEYELSWRAKTGDREARRILAVSNLARVVATAKKFANRGSRLDDLIQEGNVGLMKAIEHFDPKKNVRFATYADNRSQVRGGGAKRQSLGDFSLDAAIDGDSESSYVERLEDPDAGPQEQYISREKDTEVKAALARVRKRIGNLGWAILEERITQDKPRTLAELGLRWGVSRERVRQVELKTKTFLARYLSAFNQQETEGTADAA